MPMTIGKLLRLTSFLVLNLGLGATAACDTSITSQDTATIDGQSLHAETDTHVQAGDDTAKDSTELDDVTVPTDAVETVDTIPEPDTEPEPDTTPEEDLAGVKVSWTLDIKPIADNKCGNCHGASGYHGLKLYTRDHWETYFPMIVPSIKTGKMPQGTSMGAGQLDLIILWGKLGYAP